MTFEVLWERCRRKAEAALCRPDSMDLDIIENCIKQFARIDPSSAAFRYPVRKDGSAVLHAFSHVNVRRLAEEMANASAVIEALSNYLVVRLDEKREFEAERLP